MNVRRAVPLVLLPLLLAPTLLAQIVPPLPPNPLRKRPAAQPPAESRPFAGTFADDTLQIELQWNERAARYEGTLTYEGRRMPCRGTARETTLTGSFTSDTTEYVFTLTVQGDRGELQSDGETHQLTRRGNGGAPAPAPAANGGATGGVGIAVRANAQGDLLVAELAPGGPAATAKVPVGAVLRAVDQKRIAGLSFDQVRALCTGPVGSLVTLTLETEREVLDVVIRRGALPTAPAANIEAPPTDAPNAPNGTQPAPAAIGDYPAWMQPGTRITWFAGSATLSGVSSQLVPDDEGNWRDEQGRRYREADAPSTGGGGYTQYELVAVTPDCLAARMVTFVFADAGLRTVSRAGAQAVVGDRNGLSDVWLPPTRLRAMLQDGSGRAIRYPLDGRTYDAVVSQVRGNSGWMRSTYDLATGLLLVHSSSSTGGPVMTPNGTTSTSGSGATTIASVRLRNVHRPAVPWFGQRLPQRPQAGDQLVFSGTLRNSLGDGVVAPWRYDVGVRIDRRVGDALVATLQTRLDYGAGTQPQTGEIPMCYGPGSFAGLHLDPHTLAGLQPGHVFDRDPVTGWQLTFVGSDGRTATIAEQGPLDQQSYTYELQNGALVTTSARQQQGPATISIDVQLQRR